MTGKTAKHWKQTFKNSDKSTFNSIFQFCFAMQEDNITFYLYWRRHLALRADSGEVWDSSQFLWQFISQACPGPSGSAVSFTDKVYLYGTKLHNDWEIKLFNVFMLKFKTIVWTFQAQAILKVRTKTLNLAHDYGKLVQRVEEESDAGGSPYYSKMHCSILCYLEFPKGWWLHAHVAFG